MSNLNSPRPFGPDPQQINQAANALRYFLMGGQVTELRALFKGDSHGPPHVWSGYYDDIERLANDAVWHGMGAAGMYFIPNPVDPALLARAYNRSRPVYRGATTSDRDIIRRRFLLLDFDPVRPADISSNDAEHAAAITKARETRDWLAQRGWPTPIFVDSGNGAHLDYFIDQPIDDGGLISAVLASLAQQFNDSHVKVDVSVYNPGRIWKVVGTYARKGDDIPSRPHRLATLIDGPAERVIVTESQLRSVAGNFLDCHQQSSSPRSFRSYNSLFNLELWIAEHNLAVDGPRDWQGGRRWIFRVCPWNPEHTNGSAYIVQLADGPISAGCHHNSCQAYGWADLRDLVEPGWRTQQRRPSPELPDSLHPTIVRNLQRHLRNR